MTRNGIPREVEQELEKSNVTPSRREFLRNAGMFAATFSAAGAAGSFAPEANAQTAAAVSNDIASPAGPYPDPDFRQVDSWIVIHQDDTATFYIGKTDCGQGTGTAFRQIMSDELDFPYDRTTCIMGSTDITVDQGGSGGSTAMERDSWPMRRVAAEARRVLLEMASTRLDVPVDRLSVSEGVITETADPSKHVTYGQLIGGKRFNVAVKGNNINVITGVAASNPYRRSEMLAGLPNATTFPPRWTVR
jgi:CO/xanthine dehydrogenase Mo-binding subunit